MASDLERAVAGFRRLVLARDAAARRDLLAAYGVVRADLAPAVEALAAEVAALDDPSPADLQRLDRYRRLLDQTEAEMERLAGAAEAVIRREQTAVVAAAGDHARGLALAAAGPKTARVAVEWNRLPTAALTDLIGRMRDGSAVGEWRRTLAPAVRGRLERGLIEGLARGSGLREVAATVAKATDLAESRVLLTARNEILGAHRSATLANYAENGDVLDGWVWTAAHDERTCPACLALDGQIFPLTETFFPSHGGCRCAAAPAVSGAPWERETGAEWLARQPEAVQDRVLKPEGAAAFREGAARLDDWVVLRRDERWGDSYGPASTQQALRRAQGRKEAA